MPREVPLCRILCGRFRVCKEPSSGIRPRRALQVSYWKVAALMALGAFPSGPLQLSRRNAPFFFKRGRFRVCREPSSGIRPRRALQVSYWKVAALMAFGAFPSGPLQLSRRNAPFFFKKTIQVEHFTFRMGSLNPLWNVLGAHPSGPSLGDPVPWGGLSLCGGGGIYPSGEGASTSTHLTSVEDARTSVNCRLPATARDFFPPLMVSLSAMAPSGFPR